MSTHFENFSTVCGSTFQNSWEEPKASEALGLGPRVYESSQVMLTRCGVRSHFQGLCPGERAANTSFMQRETRFLGIPVSLGEVVLGCTLFMQVRGGQMGDLLPRI